MSKDTVIKRFYRDIRFLEKNEIPIEQYGERIDKLDYKADSSDDEIKLKCLKKNI